MRTLEAAILAELRTVTGQRKIRQKDILAWSTSKDSATPVTGEQGAFLPVLKIYVVYDEPGA